MPTITFARHRCHQPGCTRRFWTFGGLMRHILRGHPHWSHHA